MKEGIKLTPPLPQKKTTLKKSSLIRVKEHLEGKIKKASREVNVLPRITPYMNLTKLKLLMNSFFYISV